MVTTHECGWIIISPLSQNIFLSCMLSCESCSHSCIIRWVNNWLIDFLICYKKYHDNLKHLHIVCQYCSSMYRNGNVINCCVLHHIKVPPGHMYTAINHIAISVYRWAVLTHYVQMHQIIMVFLLHTKKSINQLFTKRIIVCEHEWHLNSSVGRCFGLGGLLLFKIH